MRIFAVLLGQSSSIVPATGRFPLAAICPDMAITRLYFACPGANGRSLAIADRGIKGRGRRCSGRMECDVGEQLIGHVSRHRQWHGALRVSDDQHVTVTNWVRRRRAVPVHRSLDASCVTSDSISAEVVWGMSRPWWIAPYEQLQRILDVLWCGFRRLVESDRVMADTRRFVTTECLTSPIPNGSEATAGSEATPRVSLQRSGLEEKAPLPSPRSWVCAKDLDQLEHTATGGDLYLQ